MLSKRDLVVFPELYSVTIRGYEPKKVTVTMDDGSEYTDWPEVDPPGTANWFCNAFGMACDGETNEDSEGILWTDYQLDSNIWDFSVLLTAKGREALSTFLQEQPDNGEEQGYSIATWRYVDVEQVYGDNNGTIVIMKHPEGFVIAE